MTIKQKIWSIPLIAILIFSVGMAVTYKYSSYIYTLLQRADTIHYPFLRHIQTLSGNLGSIQEGFLDALDTSSSLAISRTRHKAEDFRNTAKAIGNIEGKQEISQYITDRFNDYFDAADSAAAIIIGTKQGNVVPEMERMVIALNKLTLTLQQEQIAADQVFEKSLDDSRQNVQKMLWISLISALMVLLILAYTSHRFISSILQSLESLRAGARKFAQGDFSARIPELGKDELTMVIQSFNSMGEELQAAIKKHTQHEKQLEILNVELEGRVTTRTDELSVALDEANRANAAVAYMADHDTLTGLLSRRRFQEEYERWGKYASRYEHPMALMFIDLDKFKDVNDSYGHPGGDEYLRAVADLLKNTLRSTDYIGRWGGDEFAALLPETNSMAACEVATKLIKIFGTVPITVSGHSLFSSASIGIAVMPEHAMDADELIELADAAMYNAKNAGRGCFNLYSASEHEVQHLGEHARWAGRIRRALETDQFILFYQPLLNLKTGESLEYEALLRMEDQDGLFHSPGQFLAAAERFDLSISIDRMVIRKAAHKIATLKANNIDLRLSLNLTAEFLEDDGMLEYLRDIITEFDIKPDSLSIEISEPIILNSMNRVCNLSAEISKLGCRIVLDDISVGFSSFHFLAPLSIHSIKIQGDLIRNLHHANNRDYVTALCKTCHELNIAVVAKFVEDLTMLDSLRTIGMDYAQGFAVGRPLESLDAFNLA